jgi:hypothetical protein
VNGDFQTGTHPDADQLSVFVEGAATAREHERMLAHLAECAECRNAVFLMQPHEETQAATATPVKGWIWRRLLPVGLPAAALACGLIAVLISIRPRGSAPEVLQQNASVRRPEIQLHETTVAPAINSETVARSGRSKKTFERNAAAPNLSRQENHAEPGSNLPKSKSHQIAANLESPQTRAAAPAPVAQGGVVGGVPGGVGRGGAFRQQASQAAASQNGLAEKKDLPPLGVERASEQDATLAGLSGRITDRSGAIVAGATITLRDASGKTRQTTTGTDGSFHLTGLPAGQYELIATARGFMTNQESIELKPSELAKLQPVLDVGATSEAVTVEAESAAQQVQTESASMAGQVVAEMPGVGRVIPVPSGLPVAATVSHGKRFLSLDSAGNLFLSRNGGKKWKKINPRWAGKAVRIELTPAYTSEVPPERQNETSGPASAVAVFQLTTDADAVWTSKDGAHWHQQ